MTGFPAFGKISTIGARFLIVWMMVVAALAGPAATAAADFTLAMGKTELPGPGSGFTAGAGPAGGAPAVDSGMENGGAPAAVRGIYGVPAVRQVDPAGYERDMRAAGVNAVFVPEDEATIKWYRDRGYKVFLSVNAFGGRGPWKTWPDSRPVAATGRPYGDDRPREHEIGGVCPTHPGWRTQRLRHIAALLKSHGARADGIWLDFIRYPGLWERAGDAAYYPDACYCPRCRRLFTQHLAAAGKRPPVSLAELEAPAAAAWIRKHRPDEWRRWKQEQILSFVREVRKMRDELHVGCLLGAFIVPWTKGERDGAVFHILGQDPFALGGLVDVVSPMVYARMTGRPPAWVGEMAAYYRETMPAAVWPIIQSEETGAAEFRAAVNAAAAGGADGLLVYSFRGMKKDLWEPLRAFRLRENLLRNPGLTLPAGAGAPPGWTGCAGARTDEFGSRCFAKPAAELEKNPLVLRRPPFSTSEPPLPAAAGTGLPRPEKTGAGSGLETPPAPAAERPAGKQSGEGTSLASGTPADMPGAVGIRAGRDGRGEWRTALPPCEPGRAYLFSGYFYRDYWENGVYAQISLWGREIRLDSHLQSKKWQPLRGYVTCPAAGVKGASGDDRRPAGACAGDTSPAPAAVDTENVFIFAGDQAGRTFWMTRPVVTLAPDVDLTVVAATSPAQAVVDGRTVPEVVDRRTVPKTVQADVGGRTVPEGASVFKGLYENFFPIGVYGAGKDDLEQLRRLGVNTIVTGGGGEALARTVAACHDLNIRYVLATPHDPEHLRPFLDDIARHVRPGYLAFYVNDEPELRSAPANTAADVRRLLQDRFPGAGACMAVVRPEACRDYMPASDFFMMDQYPVIGMPMSWLADSLDRAARDVGRERLLAVIQAFREPQSGWPRRPSWEEMDALAFLSVVHGSRGIFFYTYGDIGKTEEGRQDLARVAGRLNRLYPWLLVPNTAAAVPVKMLSRYKWDPQGRPAIHVAVKKRGEETLLIAVNSIGAPVEAEFLLAEEGDRSAFVELFNNEKYPVCGGRLRSSFGAYETKAFHRPR